MVETCVLVRANDAVIIVLLNFSAFALIDRYVLTIESRKAGLGERYGSVEVARNAVGQSLPICGSSDRGRSRNQEIQDDTRKEETSRFCKDVCHSDYVKAQSLGRDSRINNLSAGAT